MVVAFARCSFSLILSSKQFNKRKNIERIDATAIRVVPLCVVGRLGRTGEPNGPVPLNICSSGNFFAG